MSTELFGVRVLAMDRASRRLRLEVFVTYYDTQSRCHDPLPRDASFFLRALFSIDFHRERGITGQQDEARHIDERWVDANAWRWIEGVVVLVERDVPDWSRVHDFQSERNDGWQNEEALVRGEYEVTLTSEAVLDDLRVGLAWGTTAYETRADWYEREFAACMPHPDRIITTVPLAELVREADGVPIEPTHSIAAVSDDGAFLAIGHAMGHGVKIFETQHFGLVRTIEARHLFSLAFAPGTTNLEVRKDVVDVASGRTVGDRGTTSNRYGGSGRVRVDPRGFDDGIVRFEGEFPPIEVAPAFVDTVSLSPDDARVVVGCDRTVTYVRDLAGGAVRTLDVPGWYDAVSWSPDARWILFAYGAHENRGWIVVDASSGDRVATCLRGPREYYGHDPARGVHPVGGTGFVNAACWDPKGRWLAVTRSSAPLVDEGVSARSWLEVIEIESQVARVR